MKETIRIGTRASALARRQTDLVAGELRARFPRLEVSIIPIQTTGDRFQGPIGPGVSTKGLFIKEIEEALLARKIDLAVHSLKDLPAEISPRLKIAAIPKRADPRDALIGRRWLDLPVEAKVGTSSPRRCAQLLFRRPDLKFVAVRGNVDTRIRKRAEKGLDALILACAGLDRLGLQAEISERLELDLSLPAPGQGALALETREDDQITAKFLESMEHRQTRLEVTAERELLRFFQAGCALPLAALGRVENDRLRLEGLIASTDGKRLVRETVEGKSEDPALARRLGENLIQKGAKELLEK